MNCNDLCGQFLIKLFSVMSVLEEFALEAKLW